MEREETYRGMHVWAIVRNEPYECIIQELGQRSDRNKCSLRFAYPKDVPLGLAIGWRRYDQIASCEGTLDVDALRQAASQPDPLTPRQETENTAKVLGFDIVQGAKGTGIEQYRSSKYFVVCDWERKLVNMFAQDECGYEQAIKWMKIQRGDPA